MTTEFIIPGLSVAWQKYVAQVARESLGPRIAAANAFDAARRGFSGSLVVAALLGQEWHEWERSVGPDVGEDVHVRTCFHPKAHLQLDAIGGTATERWVLVTERSDLSYRVVGWCWRDEMYGLGRLVHVGEPFEYIGGWAPIYNRKPQDQVVVPLDRLRPPATMMPRRVGTLEQAVAFLSRTDLDLDPRGRPWALGELIGGTRRNHVSKQTEAKRRADREAKRRQRMRDSNRPEELWS